MPICFSLMKIIGCMDSIVVQAIILSLPTALSVVDSWPTMYKYILWIKKFLLWVFILSVV